MATSLDKLVCMAFLWLVLGASNHKAQASVTCQQVVNDLTPCISYVLNGGKTVPAPCCDGIRTLFNLAKTTPDRQSVCTCIKKAVNGINYKKSSLDLAAALPKKCGVNIPYQISPATDCSRVK